MAMLSERLREWANRKRCAIFGHPFRIDTTHVDRNGFICERCATRVRSDILTNWRREFLDRLLPNQPTSYDAWRG